MIRINKFNILLWTIFVVIILSINAFSFNETIGNQNVNLGVSASVSNENNVLSLTFNDGFIPAINLNSTSCMNKEILVDINSTYALNLTTNETYLVSQFEIREKVFTGERRTVRIN